MMNDDEIKAELARRLAELDRREACRMAAVCLKAVVASLELARSHEPHLPAKYRAQIKQIEGDAGRLLSQLNEERAPSQCSSTSLG
jgi:hypothetical protein